MPTLNIRIQASDENITISKELQAQRLELVRATIYKNDTAGQIYNGSLYFNLDFFNGFEIVSNQNDNFLIAPISDEANLSLQTYQMSQDFNSEDVKRSFNVKTYYRDVNGNYQPAPFDKTGADAGKLIYVDLFFNVSQLYDYN
jgi:hypothetical protein